MLEQPTWSVASQYDPTLHLLRRIETQGLIESYGGLLRGPNTHFILESGAHLKTYVRLRSAFERIHPAKRLADWLMPYLGPNFTVFFAHRGLGALVSRVELLAFRRFGWELDIHELDPYRRQTADPHIPTSLAGRYEGTDLVVFGVDFGTRKRALDTRGDLLPSRVDSSGRLFS